MAYAKITSKGQITVPASVRQALGAARGDVLAFEVRGDYAIVTRAPALREVLDRLGHDLPLGPSLEGSEREGIASYFREVYGQETDATVYVAKPGAKRSGTSS